MAVQISGNDITVPRDGSFTRNVTIGGTLTYEDVTNIDSVGLITARNGIEIGARPGVAASISVDGNMIVSGISTFGGAANFAAISGTTGNFSSNVDVAGELTVAETIAHTGDTNNKISFPSADTITATTAGSERVRIDSSGRLLLGTTTEGQENADDLTVAGSSNSGITIRSGTSSFGQLFFSDGTSGDDEYRGIVGYSHADNFMKFHTNAVERVRIDSSGRVMIGSATYIGGAALAVLGTSSTPNAYGSFAIGKVGANPTSGTTLANIRLNGGSVGTGRGAEINAIADANWSDGSSHPTYLTFSTVASSSTSATERLRVHAGGNVDIKTGNLVISTAGKGIDFSAQTATSASGTSTTSEVLDHYEEGTWTPTLTTSNGGSFSSSHCYGYYTRVGRIIHAHFVFNSYSSQYSDMLGSGADTDGVTGGGLPFPSANNSQEYYHGDIGFYALNFPGSLSLGTPTLYTYQGSNSSNFYFYLPNDNAASQLIRVQQFGQAYVRGCIHYLAAY